MREHRYGWAIFDSRRWPIHVDLWIRDALWCHGMVRSGVGLLANWREGPGSTNRWASVRRVA